MAKGPMIEIDRQGIPVIPRLRSLGLPRYYLKARRPEVRRQSLLEQAAHLPSPFAVETFLEDLALKAAFGELVLSTKVHDRVLEACRVRLAELRGVLP